MSSCTFKLSDIENGYFVTAFTDKINYKYTDMFVSDNGESTYTVNWYGTTYYGAIILIYMIL